ncbi:tannase/feruloyl esterase family alpha/beta hydrolase [Rubellimicrobium rubrum]|uniref:Tannase/feruloyl esterase family alpha/beta hydrolase n=1 Tax=Rubellimicrobium rubrum TaxID=2585369 RepID=A0A5C4MYK6_9RHOB|nr:tannase/feruloyl esterase family alpha/beta hydrolase [Rubellimicrobium rubrum]
MELSDVEFSGAEHDGLQEFGAVHNANDPYLAAFRDTGGRLILYLGWSDEAFRRSARSTATGQSSKRLEGSRRCSPFPGFPSSRGSTTALAATRSWATPPPRCGSGRSLSTGSRVTGPRG